ncbi:TetR/AcrR family transcriptional regulator [Prauserella cavernicola]|uniref:TetR/AcrR family transcriptional regulator n=1 Tax=Prauserella cavernicola TaxID=2800127 RepID=A0A934V5V8_9PSEU|nr:TetR/AcrR family transcriptional regulator [Prauserella cavernicola]MBK1785560.1 TetR/AcrR family transcriptional regulator [Prauserella cavernicola]
MPRKVDIDAQRADLAGAVLRLAARSGLEAVSLREVAAEAGVSMGRVQHYFRTKEEMLLHGVRLAMRRIDARIGERLQCLPDEASPEQILRAAIDELLGDHPETNQVIRASVAYYARAQVNAEVFEVLFGDDDELRGLAALVVRTAQADGRADTGLDPAQEGYIIWSLADSLGVKVAFGQTTSERARATMHYHLDRVLGCGAHPGV